MVLLMLLGGLRSGEVRSLRLAGVDVGARRVKVLGKGGRERVVPVDRAFFTEVTAYLRHERPQDSTAEECFVVLRGPTRGCAMTEAGLRKIFRVHRARSGASRVRPHRMGHTYGTELAAAGIDLTWNHTRPSRGRPRPGEPVSVRRQHHGVATLNTFLKDLALWGWTDRPPRPLLWRSDLPRLPHAVPRALPPDADRDLMAAVTQLDDVAARCAITILRGTGLRLGELLDLELGCLIDYASHGTWLGVPLGKLNTERTVPLDDTTLAAFDEWTEHRGPSRPLRHQRTKELVESLFVIGGRRMVEGRIRRHLDLAAIAAGIDHVHPHQLRHTYATTLVNGGMSLEALMAVLGHVTPEMTLRYAHLASPTIRDAYDTAMAKTTTRTRLIARAGATFVPERIDWLHSEWIKTRVAHGFCNRHQTAGACDYAKICEQCDNYVPDPARRDVIDRQLADVIELRDDPAARGWDTETTRHQHVADALQRHLKTIDRNAAHGPCR